MDNITYIGGSCAIQVPLEQDSLLYIPTSLIHHKNINNRIMTVNDAPIGVISTKKFDLLLDLVSITKNKVNKKTLKKRQPKK